MEMRAELQFLSKASLGYETHGHPRQEVTVGTCTVLIILALEWHQVFNLLLTSLL